MRRLARPLGTVLIVAGVLGVAWVVCLPRFFATHRYIAYARLATVLTRGGMPYRVEAAARG
jgi:hypothetical protein